MNTQQLQEFQKQVPNFLTKECFLIDPSELEYDTKTSQIRANGHVTTKYPDYAELFRKGIKFPPISVRKMPNGKYELKEGCTRAGGAALAKVKLLATDYQDRVLKWGAPQWEDFQAQANDHVNSSPNTIADIEHFIDRQVKNGNLEQKLGYKYEDDEKKFVEDADKHYRKDICKNCGKDLDFFRRKVKKALLRKVRSNYESYSKEEAMEFYQNQTGFAGVKAGDVSNGEVVYTFKQVNHTSPAIIGHVASKLIDNPGVKVTIVYHVGDLVGKDDKKIKAERLKIEKWYDKVNSHYGWFDALYFLPQIKQGKNKEKLWKIIKSR